MSAQTASWDSSMMGAFNVLKLKKQAGCFSVKKVGCTFPAFLNGWKRYRYLLPRRGGKICKMVISYIAALVLVKCQIPFQRFWSLVSFRRNAGAKCCGFNTGKPNTTNGLTRDPQSAHHPLLCYKQLSSQFLVVSCPSIICLLVKSPSSPPVALLSTTIVVAPTCLHRTIDSGCRSKQSSPRRDCFIII